MHILIIGAAGMIGRKLTDHLVKDGAIGGRPIDALTLADVVAADKPQGFKGKVETSTVDLSAPGAAALLIRSAARYHRSSGGDRVGRGGSRFRERLPDQSRRHAGVCSRR